MDKEAMKRAVAEVVSLCVQRHEVADDELEMAVWNTPYADGAQLRTTLVRNGSQVVGMVDLPEQWRPVLGFRRIEIDFSDQAREPKVRVIGGGEFDDPDTCTIATGVYRDGRMVWNPKRKAS